MRLLRQRHVVALTSVSALLGAALWLAPRVSADGAPASAKKAKAAAKKQRAGERPLRAEQRGRRTQGGSQADEAKPRMLDGQAEPPDARRQPREHRMQRAASFDGDLRVLAQTPGRRRERPEREGPAAAPVLAPGSTSPNAAQNEPIAGPAITPGLSAPAPAPIFTFEGLDFATWGAGHPPDTNGDVGPTYYIETVNTSIGIYRKVDGVRVAAFTFDTFMSQGNFGNLCDTDNFGDPVVLYDTFEDRWVITDFAFKLSGGNVVNPPGSFQCFAVSKTGDPVSGGWNYYSINTAGGLGDYPKFGIWPDGVYMSANMFGYPAGSSFQNARLYAFNKAQMYAGAPSIQVVSFDAPASDFTLLPSNARLQTGTPPTGTPNYFVSTWQFLNALTVYKFHVDWNSIALSTFTGPDAPLAATSWPNANVANAASLGGNSLDVLQIRAMMQNQYSNIGGVESLWTTHTVRRANTAGFAAPRWYQVNVTGGTVDPNLPQAATWDPDAANVMHRFMPSLAVDRAGDMALGYSTSSSTTKPAIKYAGRLASDPPNTFSQTEQVLIQGNGTQTGSCGGSACTRWGDYSAMTLDPDGCTFWYTNEYYQVDGLNDNTRIGAFSFSQCSPIGSGTLRGTVTAANLPIGGAIVALGSRTTTTDSGGNYSFTLPAGTYPSITAGFPGYTSQTFVNIAVTDFEATTRDFSLSAAPTSNCFTDTTQADFQTGVATNCDLTGSPGAVTLLNSASIDQQNLSVTSSGFGFNNTSWAGQTFTPLVSGQLTRADVDLFCSACTGTIPNITVSIRATSGSPAVPTGADLAVATIAGFSSGAAGFFTANFSSPPTLTAGTRYAVILRTVSNPSAGTYAYVISSGNPYANGQRVTSANSGGAWAADITSGGRDLGFKIYMKSGFGSAGDFVSSVKDANPAAGRTPTWSTISWNASTPSGTTLRFQAAASNSASGPFNFVGPDRTAGTFFGNGASLTQFNGSRYLRYKALLTTSNTGTTPVLNDVTVCYADTLTAAATTIVVSPASGTYGGITNLSVTFTSSGSGVSGKSISFTLNGSGVGSSLTDAAGVATLSNVSLTGIDAGTYPGGAGANFSGDIDFAAATGSGDLTIDKAAQTITFGALGDKTFGDADFLVSAIASSGLAVSFTASGSCSVAGATVHLTGTGSCTITASQAGGSNYTAAPEVSQGFSIALATQTITFPAIASFTWAGGSATLTATASSGLAVSYGVLSGPCAVAGSTLTATSAGTCVVAADQAGNDQYSGAAQVTQTAMVAKAAQTITFGALADKSVTDPPFPVGATGGASGNPVTFSTMSTACQVTGATVTILAGGICTIRANQAGDSNYAAATEVSQGFTIVRVTQTITFPAIASFTWAGGSATLTATASSGVAVSYGVLSGPCAVAGSTLTATSAGTCVVAADQAGNDQYSGAAQVTETAVVAKAAQTITFGALGGKTFGDADFTVSATASTGLAVSFTASGNCSVAGATVHLTGAGSCTVTGSQAGNANYGPAPDVPQSFSIAKANQTITFGALANKTFDDPDFGVGATASSGLAVSFGASGNCSVAGATVHLTGAGSCTITASQTGNANYAPAPDVPQSFSIAKANQTITFGALANKTFGDPDFDVAASASSGLPVSLSATGNCTIAGTTVHLTSAGSCTITASQSGNANYNRALNVSRTFQIAKKRGRGGQGALN